MDKEKFISDLDTKRFGLRTAKIDMFDEKPETILSYLKESNVKLIISKIKSSNIRLINEMESLGFKLKDTQVTYSYFLKNIDKKHLPQIDAEVEIREFQEQDMNGVLNIIKGSFNNYGHYFADEKLDKKKCLDIYIDWGFRSCNNRDIADKIFVGLYNNELAGFLSFKRKSKENKLFSAGGLGAVHEKFRGKKVFKMLALEGLKWGLEEGHEWVEHNVLTTNYPVNSVFSTMGFKITDSFVTMHCWL